MEKKFESTMIPRLDVWGTDYELKFTKDTYLMDGSLAIQVLSRDLTEGCDYYEPFCSLTTWVSPFHKNERCAFVDTNNTPYVLIKALEDMGAMTATGYTQPSGFCEYPEYEFNESWLEVASK